MPEEGVPAEGEKKKERVNPYRLSLKPGEEQRRPEWNMIVISNIAVTVDFFHTDMLEKVISIRGAGVLVEEKKEEVKEE